MRSNIKKAKGIQAAGTNRLFPVFMKLEGLNILIVGGGKVAEEKLSAILGNAPDACVRIVAREISPGIRKLCSSYNITLSRKYFEQEDLSGVDLVFSAVNDVKTSRLIHSSARKQKVLHNAADKPALCDFYLGSIVQKGHLKIGISTNGKSPTLAKRLKKILEESLPGEIDQVLINLSSIRESLRGDLREKIRQLNTITSILTTPRNPKVHKPRKRAQRKRS
jgi:siroheme synthase-like protein